MFWCTSEGSSTDCFMCSQLTLILNTSFFQLPFSSWHMCSVEANVNECNNKTDVSCRTTTGQSTRCGLQKRLWDKTKERPRWDRCQTLDQCNVLWRKHPHVLLAHQQTCWIMGEPGTVWRWGGGRSGRSVVTLTYCFNDQRRPNNTLLLTVQSDTTYPCNATPHSGTSRSPTNPKETPITEWIMLSA